MRVQRLTLEKKGTPIGETCLQLIGHAALLHYYKRDVSWHGRMHCTKEMTWLDKCIVEIHLCLQLTLRVSSAFAHLCTYPMLYVYRVPTHESQRWY